MDAKKRAREIIRILNNRGFYAECPCCNEPVLLRTCGLFYLDDFTLQGRELFEAHQAGLRERAEELKDRRRAISAKSESGARAVNIGFILERLAPSMHSFPFERNDCRSLFDPIDYLIFEGLSSKGVVTRLLFTDIKAGHGKLAAKQKEIRALVEAKKVSLETYASEETHEK
jgi:predicted Holliday junction resolvase-like endonuclease